MDKKKRKMFECESEDIGIKTSPKHKTCMMNGNCITWEIPRLTLVEINIGDRPRGEIEVGDFVAKIVSDELFICGMESEPRRKLLSFLHHVSVSFLGQRLRVINGPLLLPS